MSPLLWILSLFSKLKSALRKRLLGGAPGETLSQYVVRKFGKHSYAQEGEDVLLWRMMDWDHSPATFVDVGCNHPFLMSNTAMFYEHGWRGVAIDPNPAFAVDFAKLRPEDTFINCGVSTTEGSLCYYQFKESLYNTFDAEKAATITGISSTLLSQIQVPVRPLSAILNEIWPGGKALLVLSACRAGHHPGRRLCRVTSLF